MQSTKILVKIKLGFIKAGLFYMTLLLIFNSCATGPKEHHLSGETMGTYYSIKYYNENPLVSKSEIDSLLVAYNQQVSTYIPNSLIAQINKRHAAKEIVALNNQSHLFVENCKLAKDIYELSGGYFDPTVMPLVNFWGFGHEDTKTSLKDTMQLDSLRQLIGFDKWNFEYLENRTIIIKPRMASLDFSATAKGFGIDLIAKYLDQKNINSYFVDIGGETRARGTKLQETDWVVGINTPEEKSSRTESKILLKLKNRSIATSGNYRNFYMEGGQKYVHTINPFTGYPEQSKLLSASIITNNCGQADGLATSCMVMGYDKAKEFIAELDDVEAIFIYLNDNNEMEIWNSPSLDSFIL